MPLKSKVIIASTDKRNILTLQNLFETNSFDFISFSDLKKLSSKIKDEMPDLLIVDADTLDGDSYDFIKKIKKNDFKRLPVILMTTAVLDESLMNLLKDSKIDEYIRKPVSHSLLIDKIKKLILVEKEELLSHFEDTQEFPFSGNLSRIPLPRILYLIKRDSSTGVLSVVRDSFKKVISFENGDPKFVVSNIVQECLGRLLVTKGRLTEEECAESLRLMKEWKKKQGETLIKMGVIEPYELDETLKMQAKERLFEAFGWFSGEYKFLAKKFLREDLTPLDIELPQIILAGVRRYYTLDELKKALDRWMDCIPTLNKKSMFSVENFRLATWDAKTVRFFDGKRTFKEIVAKRIVREIDVYHLMFSFYCLGVYTFVETESHKRSETSKVIFKELEDMKNLNAFQVLNVDYSAADSDIQKQFDTLLLKHSEDRKKVSKGDIPAIDLAIENLKAAYDVIKDNKQRLKYLKKLFLEEGIFTKETKEVVTYSDVVEKSKEYIDRGDYSRANLLLLNATKIFPNAGIIFAYLGYSTFLSIGKDKTKEVVILADARKYLNKALILAPEEMETHLFFGKMFKYIGKEEKAKQAFSKAFQINPDSKEALQELRLLNIRDRKKHTSFIKWKK